MWDRADCHRKAFARTGTTADGRFTDVSAGSIAQATQSYAYDGGAGGLDEERMARHLRACDFYSQFCIFMNNR